MLIAEGGDLRVHSVDAGTIHVDGGSMFGVVPKPLWSRHIEADDRNRIPLALRCLLIESPHGRVLVDTGVGNKETGEFSDVYGIENAGEPTRLEDSLRTLGIEPGDIDIVVSTHLHFDHAGGHLVEVGGEIRPSFPAAKVLIHRGEWEVAQGDNALSRDSYLTEQFLPLGEFGVLELDDGERDVVPGVRLVAMPGHTEHHRGVIVDLGTEKVCYPCDLVPTAAHVQLPWIMAFDLEPMVTLAQKERWLTRAGQERWILVFPHDPETAGGRAVPARSGIGCELVDPMHDLDREPRLRTQE